MNNDTDTSRWRSSEAVVVILNWIHVLGNFVISSEEHQLLLLTLTYQTRLTCFERKLFCMSTSHLFDQKPFRESAWRVEKRSWIIKCPLIDTDIDPIKIFKWTVVYWEVAMAWQVEIEKNWWLPEWVRNWNWHIAISVLTSVSRAQA